MFSYPLQVHPCRNSLDKVFRGTPVSTPKARLPDTAGDESDEEEDDGAVDLDHAITEMSQTKHTVITTVVVAGGFTVAYFVNNLQMGLSLALLVMPRNTADHLNTVLAFVGSTGSTTISFILPGLFYWKVGSALRILAPRIFY
jgi:hypothetical protein